MNYEEQFIKDFAAALKERRRAQGVKNTYTGARVDRLSADLPTYRVSADYDIRSALPVLVARSRHLYQNNPYAKKFIFMAGTNVIGPDGIRLQNRATIGSGLHSNANSHIEERWQAWGRKGVCDVTGRLSWYEMQLLYIQTMARDGEVIIRIISGYDNPFGYALQFIDTDLLDINLNRIEGNGNIIKMGVEFNQWNKPVAYWLLQRHPGDYFQRPAKATWERVLAEEIIHDFIPERVNQTRGVPWAHASMNHLAMLGGYEEAELVASRVASSKMGIITTPAGEFDRDNSEDPNDPKSNPLINAEAGSFLSLAEGSDFRPWDPTHPTSTVQMFRKAMLQGSSSGLLVSYPSLGSDLEGVSFSSIRQGTLEERDYFRMLQSHVIGNLCHRVFPEWLKMSLLTGAIRYPVTQFERLNQPTWAARTWPWVDPLRDVKANVAALEAGLTTRTALMAQDGGDYEEDILMVKAQEKKLEEKYGVTFEADKQELDALTYGEETAPAKPGNNGNGRH